MDRRKFLQATTLAAASVTASESFAAPGPSTRGLGEADRAGGLAKAAKVEAATTKSASKLIESVAPMKSSPLKASFINTKSSLADEKQDPPDLLKPIDTGAKSLLERYILEGLLYSPMEVEYLVNTMDDHISNCLSLREKAQQLETLAIAQRFEILLEQSLINYQTELAAFEEAYAPKISGTMYQPVLSSTEVKSGSGASEVFSRKRLIEDNATSVRRELLSARLEQLVRPGGGNNHVGRFAGLPHSNIITASARSKSR